jgi:S-DNA-T family DNA segregation ATPase FtsK/SpoIIIE
VLVRLLLGQCTEDFERAAPSWRTASAQAPAASGRIAPAACGWSSPRDPLRETVPTLPLSEDVDLETVAIGRREDGEPWRVKVLGTHMLIAGMTGAGKGSVL